jgi:hypothetical protein
MICSKCEYASKIKQWEHEGVRFEDTPCASCKLAEDSSRTLEYVEGLAAGPVRWPPPEATAGPDALPLSVLAEAVRGFLDLPPRTFRILQRRYHGDSYRMIGEELQVTAQAAELQLRRALEAHPHLKNLLPEKARRQAARKRKRLSMARRGKAGCGGQ